MGVIIHLYVSILGIIHLRVRNLSVLKNGGWKKRTVLNLLLIPGTPLLRGEAPLTFGNKSRKD
jgi:hypothetical protein